MSRSLFIPTICDPAVNCTDKVWKRRVAASCLYGDPRRLERPSWLRGRTASDLLADSIQTYRSRAQLTQGRQCPYVDPTRSRHTCVRDAVEGRCRWAAKSTAEGPLTNFAAVAADERLGSFEATTLAGGACASQLQTQGSSDILQRVAWVGVDDQNQRRSRDRNGRHVGRNDASVPHINHKQIVCHPARNVKMARSPRRSGDKVQGPQSGM